ncbi:MAG: hypothetical protein NXI22_14095 [bacterium]|nr:hypothetical protein [bacterium]
MIHSVRVFVAVMLGLAAWTPFVGAEETGVFVRFNVIEPTDAQYHILLGGYVHKPNWYLPRAVIPVGADKDKSKQINSGETTAWFDLKAHCGKLLHGRMNRAGGVAEFPNITVQIVSNSKAEQHRLNVELATAPNNKSIIKRFDETFAGNLTSFLVSPDLSKDAKDLETASQMTARRMRWAIEATGGERTSPKKHIIQTSFWGPQRPELNIQEAKTLWLLGFNVVGGQRPEVQAIPFAKDLRLPGHTHRVKFGPDATQSSIEELIKQQAAKQKTAFEPGTPFGFADEIAARPAIGDNLKSREHLYIWLAAQKVTPKELRVAKLSDVTPLETPAAFHAAAKENEPAARRVFYYTNRFRQVAGTQRIAWHTEAFHRHFPKGPITTTLVADHPYFGGTGLGMGFQQPDSAWGSWTLALDWFDLARNKAVDLIGIEDWMGLQYMYGPGYTWEGFQLMGFQAAIMRSGGNGETPIIAWITPSDETNLRLKSFSSLAQGAKHFFYWTYGPTATSTENYWSDLRGSYDGIARVTKQLAAAEHIIHPGKIRKTRVALLYSISSDLWQPYNYRHMLERRGTYLSLVHDQYTVDMLTEQDVEAGKLKNYQSLYVTDPCITTAATAAIQRWVHNGGSIYGSCNAGSRNEFNEPVEGLSKIYGIQPHPEATTQKGNYRTRGELNKIPHLDQVTTVSNASIPSNTFGVIGLKVDIKVDGGKTQATFKDGSPAIVSNTPGKGQSVYSATTPGISYIKDAKFIAKELAEKWPTAQRNFINDLARQSGATPSVLLSHPVVEAGVYESPAGTAVVLANFTYDDIDELKVTLPIKHPARSVRLASSLKAIPFTVIEADPSFQSAGCKKAIQFTMKLGLDEIILVE